MEKRIKSYLSNKCRWLYAIIETVRCTYFFSFTNKHFISCIKWTAITRNGISPWFTYPAIDYLDTLDLSKKNVFEYGSGNSTIYFKQKAKSIISVESDRNWYEKINLKEIKLLPNKHEYVNSIGINKFDIIIIDGYHRYECAKKAYKNIKDGGFIIFDDATDHPESIKFLESKFLRIDFIGFIPILSQRSTTTFFFKK